jgi:hypothetical protein
MGVQGCEWVILVLLGFTGFDRAGFSEDAGWGHPAYKARFGPRFHAFGEEATTRSRRLALEKGSPFGMIWPSQEQVHWEVGFGFTWFYRV